MSVYRRRGSNFLWVKFKIGGRRVRKSARTTDPQKAEEFETRLRDRLWRQIQLGEQQHTVREAFEAYLKAVGDRADIDKIRQRLNWFLGTAEFADLMLHEVDRDVLQAARAKLGESFGPTTVNHYLATVRAAFYYARDVLGWVSVVVKFPMAKRVLPDPVIATRAQVRALLAKLPENSADIARFAVSTGLRRRNVTHLEWNRVDLKRRTAFIPGSQAKARKGIAVPLNADAIAVLRRRHKAKDRHPRWVFAYRGEPVTQVATKAWRTACKAVGLEGFRFHDLRHTWASWQIQSGTPMAVVKELGGWASMAMVERYSHLTPGHLARYADRTLLRRQ